MASTHMICKIKLVHKKFNCPFMVTNTELQQGGIDSRLNSCPYRGLKQLLLTLNQDNSNVVEDSIRYMHTDIIQLHSIRFYCTQGSLYSC